MQVLEESETSYICRLDRLAAGQLHSFAAFELPEHGPHGHSQGSRLFRQEAAGGVSQVAHVATGGPLADQRWCLQYDTSQ